MVIRADITARLGDALARSPVVLLTGPRQAGKSTLSRSMPGYDRRRAFDLEDLRDAARLADPTLALGSKRELVVIDEAQRDRTILPVIRVLVDEDRRPGRFLVLGSASPTLTGLASESLAGRVTTVELGGFELTDVGADALDTLWSRGGLPLAFLAATDRESFLWREDYIATFLSRDLAQLGFGFSPTTMRRFWMMLAHYHAQIWNGAELARALGVSQPTVRRYLDALSEALVVRQLPPWSANIAKRQVKAPKVYVRDTGLLHALLGLDDAYALSGHPKVGASWEGFVLEQLIQRPEVGQPHFWATHGGAEIDLVCTVGGALVGVEIKRTDRPKVTPSIRHALAELDLDYVIVVHAGEHDFPLADRVRAVSARTVLLTGPG